MKTGKLAEKLIKNTSISTSFQELLGRLSVFQLCEPIWFSATLQHVCEVFFSCTGVLHIIFHPPLGVCEVFWRCFASKRCFLLSLFEISELSHFEVFSHLFQVLCHLGPGPNDGWFISGQASIFRWACFKKKEKNKIKYNKAEGRIYIYLDYNIKTTHVRI